MMCSHDVHRIFRFTGFLMLPSKSIVVFFNSNSNDRIGMLILSVDFVKHLGLGAGGDKSFILFIENN